MDHQTSPRAAATPRRWPLFLVGVLLFVLGPVIYVIAINLHHLETPERVATTVREMGRVVKHSGFIVLWDHNPANPYWPILMKRTWPEP